MTFDPQNKNKWQLFAAQCFNNTCGWNCAANSLTNKKWEMRKNCAGNILFHNKGPMKTLRFAHFATVNRKWCYEEAAIENSWVRVSCGFALAPSLSIFGHSFHFGNSFFLIKKCRVTFWEKKVWLCLFLGGEQKVNNSSLFRWLLRAKVGHDIGLFGFLQFSVPGEACVGAEWQGNSQNRCCVHGDASCASDCGESCFCLLASCMVETTDWICTLVCYLYSVNGQGRLARLFICSLRQWEINAHWW